MKNQIDIFYENGNREEIKFCDFELDDNCVDPMSYTLNKIIWDKEKETGKSYNVYKICHPMVDVFYVPELFIAIIRDNRNDDFRAYDYQIAKTIFLILQNNERIYREFGEVR